MFPLQTKSFPSSPSELSRLLNESIRSVFVVKQDPVTILGDSYPDLEGIEINLNGGQLSPSAPRPVVEGEQTAGLQVRQLRVEAAGLSIGPALADLHLTACDVTLEQARDSKDEIVLVLKRAAEGKIEIVIETAELEKAIGALAGLEAKKQGATIEDVSLTFRNEGPRSVSGEIQVKARKLFFSTVIRVSGSLALDEELNATVSGLGCKGDGAIGALACGFLSPHLQKLDGRTFPLMALPLGEIRLRDVRISAAEKITVKAEFGA